MGIWAWTLECVGWVCIIGGYLGVDIRVCGLGVYNRLCPFWKQQFHITATVDTFSQLHLYSSKPTQERGCLSRICTFETLREYVT